MDPNALLEWILRLRAAIDAAIDDARPVDTDAVYTLVGLVDELDQWLAQGRRPPDRWRPALRGEPGAALLVFDARNVASNDAPAPAPAPMRAPTRRRPAVRRGAAPTGQLPLPFRAGTG